MNHQVKTSAASKKLSLANVLKAHQGAFKSHSAALLAEEAAITASNEAPDRTDLKCAAMAATKRRELTGKAESKAAHIVFVFPCLTLREVQRKAKYLLGKTVWCDFIPEADHVAMVLRSFLPVK